MNGITRALTALTVALVAGPADAGHHHICYQDITESNLMQVIVACQDDHGNACTVKPDQAGVATDSRYLGNWHPRIAMATPLLAFQYGGRTTLSFSLEFKNGDGTTTHRRCKVPYRLQGEPSGVLSGYSTDESGLVTTGSWRVDGVGGPTAKIWVPGDFIVTGGGFAAEPSSGARAFIRYAKSNPSVGTILVWNPALKAHESLPRWDSRTWEVASDDTTGAAARLQSAEVIGLHVEGTAVDTATDLFWSLKSFEAGSAGPLAMPGTVVRRIDPYLPAGEDPAKDAERVILGGDVWTEVSSASGVGQLLTATAAEAGPTRLLCLTQVNPGPCPVASAEQWRVGSIGPSFPGSISGRILTLTPTIELGGQTWEVRSRLVSTSSSTSQDPKAATKGLRGRYAVTGLGGQIRGLPTQTRLADVTPRLDTGGASVGTGSSGAEITRVTASAIGIRLVKPGTPADFEEWPLREAQAIDIDWICRVIPDLDGTSSLCAEKSQALSAKQLCASYPELQKHGVCVRQ